MVGPSPTIAMYRERFPKTRVWLKYTFRVHTAGAGVKEHLSVGVRISAGSYSL